MAKDLRDMRDEVMSKGRGFPPERAASTKALRQDPGFPMRQHGNPVATAEVPKVRDTEGAGGEVPGSWVS